MPPEPTRDLDSSLKMTRTLHAVLLLTIPLLAYAGEVLAPAKTKDVKKMGLILIALAALNIWTALSTSRRSVQQEHEALRVRPEDTKAIIRWRAATIASLVVCEPLALYGCVLRVWGGTFLEAVPFYACGLLLLFAFTPRRPSRHVAAHPAA